MNQLLLSQGFSATIDEEDWEGASQWKWTAMRAGGSIYACRREPRENGKRRLILLHRWLLDAPAGMDVDHINGDALDNRRANLRVAKRHQNAANSSVVKGATPVRGVWLDRKTGKYRAFLTVRGYRCALGYFTTAEEASAAYEKARLRHVGEFVPVKS